MESIIYLVSIFSEELLLFQGLFIGITATAYFGYLIIKKRRYGIFHKNTSAFLVKEYLDEVIGETEEVRNQLFGILSGGEPTLSPQKKPKEPALSTASSTLTAAPLDNEKLGQLEKQISDLSLKATQLEKDKKELENKLKNMPTAVAAAPLTGDAAELAQKIKDLEDRLNEYSIIEDDLANLKKLQQENAQLKAALEGKEGAPGSDTGSDTDSAPVEAATSEETISEPTSEKAVEASATAPEASVVETPNFDELVDNVEKSLEETPTEAAVEEQAEAAPQATAPESTPAKEKNKEPQMETKKDSTPDEAQDKISKDDEDLLKEFERMLNV